MRGKCKSSRSSGRESAQTSDPRKHQSRLTSAATEIHEQAVPYRVAANVSSRPTSDQPSAHEAPPPLTCLDLFCGCGGFSLGMERAGFRVLAAIDSNPEAIAVFKANFPDVPHALCEDLTHFSPEKLATLLRSSVAANVRSTAPHPPGGHPLPIGWGEGRGEGGVSIVDVIVGGPPCQGFSKARMRDGANHGSKRFVEDSRRHLYREFLRYVEFFRPSVFVMENVLGIRSAVGGEYLTRVQKEARALGYRVHGQIEDAWELGVPQKRRRQLIIGVRNDLPGYFLPELKPALRAEPRTWLGAAVGDLPILRAGGGEDERNYDLARRAEHARQYGDTAKKYLFDVLEIDRAPKLTNHVARPHSERDLRDFARLKEGESSAQAMRRGVQFEYPYSKEHFKDRYTRQSRWHPCSTIVAHLSKDGLMFIHPKQCRSLTPREAARIQSFPDWFRFPAARTHAFRLIGNAVPPLVAEAVGLAVKEFLSNTCASQHGETHFKSEIRNPKSEMEQRPAAARELERLARLDRRALRALPREEFLRGWHALLFLFPGLHPDNALDHGDAIEEVHAGQLALPGLEKVLARRHARGGWPSALQRARNPLLN